MVLQQLFFTGKSGTKYTFYLFPWSLEFPIHAGVYAVVRRETTSWPVIYVGKAKNVQERHADHEHGPGFARHKATHLAFLQVEHDNTRHAIEADLIAHYNPPLNGNGHS